MSNIKPIIGKFLATLCTKSYKVTQFARLVVQIYDNDRNADFKENGELKILSHMTHLGDNHSIFIDVGANIGNYSIELIKSGITGRLFLVDPLKKNLSIAKKQILDLGYKNFELIQCALSDSTGIQFFFSNLDDNLSSHDSLHDMNSIGYAEKTEKIEVEVKKFDDIFVHPEIKKIHFLKIDVEGNELFVLKGATNFLTRGAIDFIQFEFGNATKAARVYLHDIINFLEPKQYKIYIIKPSGLAPLEYTPFTEMRYSYINFLAVHKSSIHKILDIVVPH